MKVYINSSHRYLDYLTDLQAAMDYCDAVCKTGDAVKIVTDSSVASKVFGFPGVWYVRNNDGYKYAWDQC